MRRVQPLDDGLHQLVGGRRMRRGFVNLHLHLPGFVGYRHRLGH
jgi:hypothetical protein